MATRKAVLPTPVTLEPPKHLNPAAAQHWQEVLDALAPEHELQPSDGEILALYCDFYARWLRARQALEVEGLISDQGRPNPYVQIADQCAKEMRGLLTELGMTPLARKRLKDLRSRALRQDEITGIKVEIPGRARAWN